MTSTGPGTDYAARRLRRRIERAIAEAGDEASLWPADGRLLVAVSGGADSSALLLALGEMARGRGLRLTAGHFDHGLRGEAESARERAAVSCLAERCGVEAVYGEGDVAALAKARRLSIEEAARRARYEFLARAAEERGITHVATGHTADDQAETVLLHLARGAGIGGLGGMAPRSPWPFPAHGALTLVRPLLSVSHKETLAYCRAAGVTPVADPTNESPDFARNLVRMRVLPELGRLNPRIVEALGRLAESARSDAALLDALAAEAVTAPAPGRVALNRARVRAMPPGLRAHAVRAALKLLLGDTQGLARRHIEAVVDTATRPEGGAILDLPRGVHALSSHDYVELIKASPAVLELPEEAVRLGVPGEVHLGDLVLRAGAAPLEGAVASVVADAAAVGQALTARRWRPGDRMQPLGMEGSKKLQDLFVDARVARGARRNVPIFENARGIAWVGGIRLAEWARPRPGGPTVVLSYRRRSATGTP